MQSVAVVLLNYNGESLLQEYLPIVVEHSKAAAKVYVIDNASTDNSLDILREFEEDVTTIALEKNLGFAAGYNSGLKQVKADIYILLNTDIQVTNNWLQPVLLQLENEKVVVAMPKILDAGSPRYFEHAGAAGGFIDAWGFPFCRGRIFDTIEEDNGQYDTTIECHWASGAAFFIKSKVFWDAGGFDQRFFMHMEEIDLCWRLQHMGYTIVCEPKSTVYHVGGGSLAYDNPKKIYLNFRNNLWMCARNWGNIERIWKIPIRFLIDGLAAWRFLFTGKPAGFLAIFKAHVAFTLSIFTARSGIKRQQGKKSKGIWNGLLLPYSYFIQGKKTFKDLHNH